LDVLLNLGLCSPFNHGILAVLTAVMAAVAARRAPLWRLFALAAAGSLLIIPHVYWYDATLLLLPLWSGMALSFRPATRVVLATLCHAVTSFLFLLVAPLRAILPLALFLAAATDPAREDPPGVEKRRMGTSCPNGAALEPAGREGTRGKSA